MMRCVLLFLLSLVIIIIIIDARSIEDYSINYPHHLEHSKSFETLRWSPRKLEQSELCEFCDIIVPVVGNNSLS